ncbi:hypothetical protein KC19_1G314000, partial [Ceratodon purpureus]
KKKKKKNLLPQQYSTSNIPHSQHHPLTPLSPNPPAPPPPPCLHHITTTPSLSQSTPLPTPHRLKSPRPSATPDQTSNRRNSREKFTPRSLPAKIHSQRSPNLPSQSMIARTRTPRRSPPPRRIPESRPPRSSSLAIT